MTQLWYIADDYEEKYIPRLCVVEAKETKTGYLAKLRKWQTRGVVIPMQRVGGEWSRYHLTPRAAWLAYEERCKTAISERRRGIEEFERKLKLAQAALQEVLA